MPSSKSRVQLITHSHHPIFLNSNQSEQPQHGSFVNFQSTRNRSPSCSSHTSRSTESIFIEKTVKPTKNSESVVKQDFCKIIVRTLLLVLLYYLSSIGLTFYQKWLMRVNKLKNLQQNYSNLISIFFSRDCIIHYRLSSVILLSNSF